MIRMTLRRHNSNQTVFIRIHLQTMVKVDLALVLGQLVEWLLVALMIHLDHLI